MIKSVDLKNFGPIKQLKWENLGRINLVIGTNGAGKTFLLKALYATIRTLETYNRGNDRRSASEILSEKLYWTFQPGRLGDLVTKGADEALSCTLGIGSRKDKDEKTFSYSFGRDTVRQIATLENHVSTRNANSIFLPAKEVLSLHGIILKTREQDKIFGFDDTCLDLVRALQIPTQKGKNYQAFSKSREQLENLLGGRVEYDEKSGQWHFKQGNRKFPIGMTAEGIKKIAILDTLLGNRYLDNQSIVFVDEPEAALHPAAVSSFLEIIGLLADCGMQFFLASHSYFVVKKLFLMARKQKWSIPVLAWEDGAWTACDMQDGMPKNTIIEESVRLYREEVELACE